MSEKAVYIDYRLSESAILGREAVDVEIEREETLPTAELEKNRFVPKLAHDCIIRRTAL